MAKSFYIFGGDRADFDETDTIAAFSTVTMEWKKAGVLNQARLAHGVFIQQGDFIVVGGMDGLLGTERCILNGDAINCTVVEPTLHYYFYYPEMMAVEPDYCPK